jgi:hypothetical protein
MKRFWFQFEFDNQTNIPAGLSIGCGITAFDYSDAINILEQKIFKNKKVPHIKKLTEDIDISTLDSGHVLPNMNVPNLRGIWFPMGYE